MPESYNVQDDAHTVMKQGTGYVMGGTAALVRGHAGPANTIPAPHGPHAHAHQFDNAKQQHTSAVLGMWAFLATEVLFFGGVFAAYAVYRNQYPGEFVGGSKLLNTNLGAFNTMVLLTSSLTMAFAVRCAHLGQRKATGMFILLTTLFGLAFLGVKAVEYTTDYHEQLIPKLSWDDNRDFRTYIEEEAAKAGQKPDERSNGPIENRKVKLFYLFYFSMTGIHALHMVIGAAIMVILATRVLRGHYRFEAHNSVEMVGLYWHFVDVVWIFLYPLLYLIR